MGSQDGMRWVISGGVKEVAAAGEDVLAGDDVTSSGSFPSGPWSWVVSIQGR